MGRTAPYSLTRGVHFSPLLQVQAHSPSPRQAGSRKEPESEQPSLGLSSNSVSRRARVGPARAGRELRFQLLRWPAEWPQASR